MALYVKKFGGTSIGTLDRINHVAGIIAESYLQGNQVVVVVSAMGDKTDRLIDLAKQLTDKPEPREYAMLLTTGEQISMSLLCMALHERGIKAKSYTGAQAEIYTSSHFTKARIERINASKLKADLKDNTIVIVAGFQGVSESGEITTLGRGGSDTTAVALAACLGAEECQIYTDVDGVYTADPRIVSMAQRLDHITFEEMLELASQGANVLQNRAVEFAGKYQVPLRVLSTFKPGSGTLITYNMERRMEQPIVSGVAFNRNEAKLTLRGIPDSPGAAYQILGPISAAGVSVDMIIQNTAVHGLTDFTFTMHRDDYEQALSLLTKIKQDLAADCVIGDTKIAKLSLVGVGMRSHPGIASKLFDTLSKEGINIQMIATSEIKVSVVIDEKYVELGLRAVHNAFGLDVTPVEEFDPV
jgi:aspartate kinase